MTYTARKAIRDALNVLDNKDSERNAAIREAMEEMRRAKYRTIRAKRWAGA